MDALKSMLRTVATVAVLVILLCCPGLVSVTLGLISVLATIVVVAAPLPLALAVLCHAALTEGRP